MNLDLRERLADEMKAALKAQQKRRLGTLRLVLATIKDRDIAQQTSGRDLLSEAEILEVLQKMVKQRQESSDTYRQAGRKDLEDQEVEEIAIIREFLPRAMEEDEMRTAIGAVVAETGAGSLKDMGRTMAMLRARFAGRMDFGKASAIVKELLS